MTNVIDNQGASNIIGLFDLSAPIRDVYLSVLNAGAISVNDFMQTADLHIDRIEVKIYLDILVKQGYLEKYKENNIIKYKVYF